jgi:hypothetical protein
MKAMETSQRLRALEDWKRVCGYTGRLDVW